MSAAPIFDGDAPPGYLSEQGKQRYIVAVIATAVGIFLAQTVLPMLVFMPMFMSNIMSGAFGMTFPQVERCVYWDDRIWIPEQSIGASRSSSSRLTGLETKEDGEKVQKDVPISAPWLLPGDDRLWLISDDAVGWFRDGETTVDRPLITPIRKSQPFIYEGNPAVLAEVEDDKANQPPPNRAAGPQAGPIPAVAGYSQNLETLAVWSFVDGEWSRQGVMEMNIVNQSLFEADSLQIVTAGETMYAFVYLYGDLYVRKEITVTAADAADAVADADDGTANTDESADSANTETAGTEETDNADDMEPVADVEDAADEQAATGNDVATADDFGMLDARYWTRVKDSIVDWKAVVVDGKPVVVFREHKGAQEQVVALQIAGDEWNQIFQQDLGMVDSVGVCRVEDDNRVAVVSRSIFGALIVEEYEDWQAAGTYRYADDTSPFGSDWFGTYTIGMNTLSAVTLIILVVAFSWLMAAYRDPSFHSAIGGLPFAPLWRRGCALGVDMTIGSLPSLPLLWWIYTDFTQFFEGQGFARLAAWLSVSILWGMAILALLSITEGRWGVTPGKWLFGIRVVGTDLRPCGIALGIVRRLLLFVDSLFQFLVGTLLIALTTNQQRLGDLAAGTVVLRVDSIRQLRDDFAERHSTPASPH